MKKSLKTTLLTAALAVSMHANAAGGVPTIDGAALASLMQQFVLLNEQLSTMQENLMQTKSTADNFIGEVQYYRDLISNISFQKIAGGYVSENASEVLEIVRNGMNSKNPAISAKISEIMQSSPALKELEEGKLKQALEKSRREMAYYQAAYEQAYNAANERLQMAAQLGDASGKVQTEKEARALQLAMSQQQLVALNDIARQMAMEKMRDAEEEQRKANFKAAMALDLQKRLEYYNKGK